MRTLKWEDIHLADYLNYYRSIKPYVGTDEYGTKAIINTIFSFTDITDEEYLDLPEAEFTALEEQAFRLLSTTEKMPLVKSFEINGVKYGFIPALDEMTYGEYLDLVTYTKKDLWDNIPTVMSTMYRPITKQLGNSYTIEKYSGTKSEITELFKDGLTMDVVFGALSFFFGFAEGLTDRYPDLFTGNVDEQDPRQLSSTSGFDSKWSQYHTIAILTGNDILKFDSVTELPIHQCLTYLSYTKDYQQVQQQAAKQYQQYK